MSDFVSITPGQQLPLQLDKLVAPFGRPMLVDGIRFRIDVNKVGALVSSNSDQALSFQARIFVGPYALTSDFVAVAGLGVREQYLQGEVLPAQSNAVISPSRSSDGTWSAQYTWRFNEPMYVPAGIPVRIALKRAAGAQDDEIFAGGAGTAAPVSATIYGRYFKDQIAPEGDGVPIPYATTYVDPTVPAAANASVQQVMSAETDLRNQTSDTFYAERLIGRLPTRDVTALTFGEYSGPEPTVRIVRTWSGGDFADVQGRASHRALVDPPKPFNAIFDLQSRALELGGVEIPPTHGFQIAVLKQTNTTLKMAQLRVFPVLGLVGVREETW